ncbi:YihY/virulence factor BrkB family protein [Halopseudomonas nanhaiensis]|uniref:YihY/virulence factor BrkB family protein n=1 Tax=Halopseudomonas nanhaiensis TaxID=2830842 RepID=UPI001CC15A9C|nr:YihY/virulence factor BrkB family protein [Halopseudomonas nanhaiensis]UAW99928.1 YihY/virulence factor BrkB family protein [Halopseudomonas nanhaiensis]
MRLFNTHGLGWADLTRRTFKAYARDRMQTYAAALAFRTIFAVFPFFLFLIAILGFLGIPEFFTWLRQQAEVVLPEAIVEQLNPVIEELKTRRGGALVGGVIVSLWTAALAVRDLMLAMNNAYEVEESRPLWKIVGITVGTTLAITAMLLLTAGLMLLGPDATQWLSDQLDPGERIAWVWGWLRWPVIVTMLFFIAALLYYVTPDVKQRFRFVTPGSLIAVPVWIGASIGFSFYMRNFADYGAVYGGLGAIIMLLLYFYVSSLVLLLGAEVNAVIEHCSKGGKPDGARSAGR